jgi:LETM1 and EF-hand domain-containing protein 1, mitochondrial
VVASQYLTVSVDIMRLLSRLAYRRLYLFSRFAPHLIRLVVAYSYRTLEELAKEQKRKASKRKKELEDAGVDLEKEGDLTIEAQKDSAGSMLEFLEKARNGEMIPPDVIIRYANYFKDDLTLDNMPRMQLINMCKYMGIQPYGSDSFLRFQLRHKIRVLKEDDQRILWEGIDSLTKMELREACQERGMRSTGLSKDAYRRALQQWLDLSVNKDLPIALLIMSRTFFLREEMFEREPADDSKSLAGLADAISGMDKEILNEVILDVATKEEKRSDRDVRKIKLEVLSQQNELIREEEQAREAAVKKKGAAEKSKADKVATEEAPPSVQAATEASLSPTNDVAASKAAKLEADVRASDVSEVAEQRNLSAEEMDAISQLISDDPVRKERKELERIKAAMKVDKDSDAAKVAEVVSPTAKPSPLEATPEELIGAATAESSTQPMSSEVADRLAKETIDKIDKEAAAEADESTKVSLDAHIGTSSSVEKETTSTSEEDEVEDPIVARLKKRVASMVDKIEVQLSETQVKIGDKLHYLDKDGDGILSREEMVGALQQVLKREISFEEAMKIADEMVSKCCLTCLVHIQRR